MKIVATLLVAILLSPPLRAADIVFLGDSLTSGYGVPRGQAYPELIAARLAREGRPHRVVNAGVSGETTDDGLRRVPRVVNADTAVLVVALGANDGLRQVAPARIRDNLLRIIAEARARSPEGRILLAGMRLPEELGRDYARAYAAIFPAVAETADVPLLPFLLEGVGGIATLNQPDRLHPTAAGQKVIAETVWPALLPLLDER